jgi:hypothetical protein
MEAVMRLLSSYAQASEGYEAVAGESLSAPGSTREAGAPWFRYGRVAAAKVSIPRPA